jgi:hypothetical protein
MDPAHGNQMTDLHTTVASVSWINRKSARLAIICATVFGMCAVIALSIAFISASGDVSELREERECFQTASNEFNAAVASSIEVILDLNDANTDLNNASIRLNAALVEALVSLGRDSDEALQAALDEADAVLAEVDPFIARAKLLEVRADEVVAQLHDALESRERQLTNC